MAAACLHCGTPFPLDANPVRRYCSTTHRVSAYQKRKRATERATRAQALALVEAGASHEAIRAALL